MRRLFQKAKGMVRGAPTGVLISIAVHIAVFLVAGSIIFIEKVKPEKKFTPPPVIERPKMPPKKPQVKKQTSRPASSTRIMSKSVVAAPEFSLPELKGSGAGLSGGGIEGLDLVPDLSDVGLFGSKKPMSVGNDFEGTFYSFAYDRLGKPTGVDSEVGREYCVPTFRKFIESGWNPNVFASYYRSPQKLYTSQFVIPVSISIVGPRAFGIVDPEFNPGMWFVHYHGKIASKKGGRFRFWGAGDLFFLVGVEKKLILDASWDFERGQVTGWTSSDPDDLNYHLGKYSSTIGDWFELKPGEPVEMDVLMLDEGGAGGYMGFFLVVQEENGLYARVEGDIDRGAPILPVFKTAEITGRVRYEIEYGTIRDELDLNSPLMFNVY